MTAMKFLWGMMSKKFWVGKGRNIMKSMTGFGRGDYQDEEVDFLIEIKTINHRLRDFFIKIAETLNPIDE